MTTTFGEMIRKAREELDVSSVEVSDDTGVGTKMLRLYEDDRAIPSLTTALKLAAYFGISLDALKEGVKLPVEMH